MSNLVFNIAEAQTTRTNSSNLENNVINQVVPQNLFGSGLAGTLNQLFYAGLVVAVALALAMVIRGGIQYMTTDGGSGKGDAKKRIQAALGGLVLAFSAILILNTINPGLTRLDVSGLRTPIQGINGQGVPITGGATASSTGPTSGTRDPATGQPNGTGANAVVKGDFSHVTAADLRPHLGSGYSDADVQAFIDAGRQYGIDPRFLAAVSKFETDNGTSRAFTDGRNNAMGTSNSARPVGFSSVRESIFSQSNSLTRDGGYYSNATTIQQIGNIYSPPINPATGKPYPNDINGTNWSWGENVTSNYNQMTGGRTGN